MKVLCAWCEQEGKPALIRESESNACAQAPHGICREHESALRKRVEVLASQTLTSPMTTTSACRSAMTARAACS